MALEGAAVNNVSSMINWSQVFGPNFMGDLGYLVKVGEALGIALIAYIIFLIIRAIMQMKTASQIKKISKNVEEINEKIEKLVRKQKKK
jgi:large-conductance mechanosensitive channel